MNNSEEEIKCKLRMEYYDLLPDMELLNNKLKLEIQCSLKEMIVRLKPYQRIEIVSRIKECESAIKSLKSRGEAADFDERKNYSLASLHDLIGVRVLYFPCELKDKIKNLLNEKFIGWNYDPIKYIEDEEIAKFYGKFEGHDLITEYQIVPMLIGRFWDVEHSLYYKPHSQYKSIKTSEFLKNTYSNAVKSLYEFEKNLEEEIKNKI